MAQQPSSAAPASYIHHAPKKVFIQKMREEEEEEKLQKARECNSNSPTSSTRDSPCNSPRTSSSKSPNHGSPSVSPHTPHTPHTPVSQPEIEDLPSIPSIPSVLSVSSDFVLSPAIFDENKPIDLSSPASGKHRGSKDFAFEGAGTLSPGSHSSGSQRSSPGSPTVKSERSSPPAKRGASSGKNMDVAMQMDTGDLFESKKPRLEQGNSRDSSSSNSSGGHQKHNIGKPNHCVNLLNQKHNSHDEIEGLQRQMQSLYQMPVSSSLPPHTMVPHTIAPLLVTAAMTSHVNSSMGVGFRPYLPDPALMQAATRASAMSQSHFPTPSTQSHMMPPPLQDPLSQAERMAMLSQPLHTVVAERLSQMFGKDSEAYHMGRRQSAEVCSSDQLGERRHSASSTGSNSPTSTFNPEPRGKIFREMDYQLGAPPMSLAEAHQMAYHMAQEHGISSTCGPDGRGMHIKKEQSAEQSRMLDNILDKKLQPLPPSDSTKSDEIHSCQVCGDVAAGFHCGAYVCEACKKFFVRCLKQDGGIKFVCPRSKGCQITKDTRTQCQYCRYQKCVEIGMYRPGGANISAEISNIPCKVCGAPSSGYHFGAITCEGCKGFFRRTVKERDSMKYQCSRSGSCIITTATRNICKFCRYQKCLDVGMKPDGSRIGRQPNSVKHATMLELQHIKHSKDSKMEIKLEPVDPMDSPNNSGPNSPEGQMVSTYDGMPQLPQELPHRIPPPSSQQRVPQSPSLPPPMLPQLEISHEVRTTAQHVAFQRETMPGAYEQRLMNPSIAQMQHMSSSLGQQPQLSVQEQVMRSVHDVMHEQQHHHHQQQQPPHLHPQHHHHPHLQHQQMHRQQQDPSLVRSHEQHPPSHHVMHMQDTGLRIPMPHSSSHHTNNPVQHDAAHSGQYNVDSRGSPASASAITSRLQSTSSMESSTSVSNTPTSHAEVHTPMSQKSESSPQASSTPGSSSMTPSPSAQSTPPAGSPRVPMEELDTIINALDGAKKDLRIMKRRCPTLPETIPADSSDKDVWHWMMVQFSQCAHAAVKFAKKVPGFRKREIQEQIQLIQTCMYPIVMALLATDYNVEKSKYNYFCLKDEEEQLVLTRYPQFVSLLSPFHSIGQAVKNMQMDETEVAFLCAMTLTTEGSNHAGQEQLVAALQEYCKRKEGGDSSRAGLILLRLCELSRANMAHQTAVMAIHANKEKYGELEMPQLFQETFMND